jgi:hypothetical protein
MKIKSSELKDAALDWAVAKARYGKDMEAVMNHPAVANIPYKPSTDWRQGGPIIEHMDIAVVPVDDSDLPDKWKACDVLIGSEVWLFGATPLKATMRCYVASKLGDEVDVPDELIGE